MRFPVIVAGALLTLLVAAALWPPSSVAQGSWVIERFHTTIAIESADAILVTEAIDVDFGDLQRRGIFRDIPVRYAWPDDPGRVRLYELTVLAVTNEQGQRWKYQEEREGAMVRIRIGDENVFLRGKQTYRLHYRVRGALNAFPGHDELFWNATGNQWEVTMRAASATVTMSTPDLTRADCFQGPTGSTERCRFELTPSEARFTATRSQAPGSGLTLVVAIRKGALVPAPRPILVDAPVEVRPEVLIQPGPMAVLAVFIVIGGIGWVVWRWWAAGRDQRYVATPMLTDNPGVEVTPLFGRHQVVVEFEPPEGLRPAEAGLLIDEHVDTRDVTATIIDLAVRGYLTITEVDAAGLSGLFGGKDWRLQRTDEGKPELQGWEAIVFRGLFNGKDDVALSDLKNRFYKDLNKAQQELYRQAVKRKWFTANPDSVRTAWAAAGTTLLILPVVGTVLGVALLSALLPAWLLAGFVYVPVACFAVGLVVIVASRAMPKRTALGSELTRRVLGFRLYVDTAEQRRQEFNEKRHIFAAYLPYAIVFNLVHKWARAFEGIEVEPSTVAWYRGNQSFAVGAFSNQLRTFDARLTTTLASTPGGSGGSGFSGGGSSGGGGGGGGGGSW